MAGIEDVQAETDFLGKNRAKHLSNCRKPFLCFFFLLFHPFLKK